MYRLISFFSLAFCIFLPKVQCNKTDVKWSARFEDVHQVNHVILRNGDIFVDYTQLGDLLDSSGHDDEYYRVYSSSGELKKSCEITNSTFSYFRSSIRRNFIPFGKSNVAITWTQEERREKYLHAYFVYTENCFTKHQMIPFNHPREKSYIRHLAVLGENNTVNVIVETSGPELCGTKSCRITLDYGQQQDQEITHKINAFRGEISQNAVMTPIDVRDFSRGYYLIHQHSEFLRILILDSSYEVTKTINTQLSHSAWRIEDIFHANDNGNLLVCGGYDFYRVGKTVSKKINCHLVNSKSDHSISWDNFDESMLGRIISTKNGNFLILSLVKHKSQTPLQQDVLKVKTIYSDGSPGEEINVDLLDINIKHFWNVQVAIDERNNKVYHTAVYMEGKGIFMMDVRSFDLFGSDKNEKKN